MVGGNCIGAPLIGRAGRSGFVRSDEYVRGSDYYVAERELMVVSLACDFYAPAVNR